MPIYEYRCTKCGTEFEKIVFSQDGEKSVPCPECKSKKTRKMISRFAGGKSGCGGCTATTCSTA